VVTGTGQLSSLGNDVASFGEALREGRSGIAPIESIDSSKLRMRNVAEVRGFEPNRDLPGRPVQWLDRFAQLALAAAIDAVRDSGVEWTDEMRERTAVVTGTAGGGQLATGNGYIELYERGRSRVHPLSVPRIMANAGASQIATEFGVFGPTYTVSTACASSNHAIGQAFWMVRNGQVDMALAGGSEAPFSFGYLKAWEAAQALDPETCRPFSKDRKGTILGEGAAMLVLEPLEHALARGAEIVGEIVGFGMSADAEHLTQPSGAGAVRAMRAALRDAELVPEAVGYINAHGTGTPLNDSTEARAICEVLGDRARRVPVSSTKSMHGHTQGAAGAIEAVATLLALRDGFIPPTANYTEPDRECDLDVVPNEAREADVDYALSNTFAFGGLNAVLALRGPSPAGRWRRRASARG
jgi:nodulation protein E